MTDTPHDAIWEKRFKETADLLPGIVCEGDTQMRVTYANEFAFKSFKYTPEDIAAGIYLHNLIHPDDRERAVENVKRLIAGQYVGPQEYRLVHKDGTMSDYQINSSTMYEAGKVVGIRTCIFDVSERKRAVEALRAGEERFRRIFQESPAGAALFDEAGRLIEGNRVFESLFPPSENPETGPGLFDLVPPAAEARRSLDEGHAVRYDAEVMLPHLEGAGEGTRYLEWTVGRLAAGETSAASYLAQVHDVTDRRTAEELRIREAEAAAEKAEALVKSLRQEVLESFTFSDMVSRSPDMKKIFDILPQVSVSPTTVLISGESGTGKELIAKALHQLSPRKRKPFVAVNCSALPDNLLESELFGYKAGAFTDAKRDKPGKFSLAEGGVLFLDEIGDISPAMQVKLLRVLQEKTYEPLGGTESFKADVRIVAATHRDLSRMVESGAFREDLFYRINVLKIKLPPLRERRMDIPLLIEYFVQRFNRRYSKQLSGVSKAVTDRLMVHEFNGNIRELENIIEHAFVFCTEGEISLSHLPEELSAKPDAADRADVLLSIGSLDELEAHYLRAILEETGGSRIEAAKRLGVHKSTLFRKLKKLGINEGV